MNNCNSIKKNSYHVNFTLSDDGGKTHKKIREKLDKIQENCTFIAFWLRIILSSTLQK